MNSPILVADAVGVSVGGVSIVEAASLSIAAGEFVGLLGPNGAGKTTLLRTIAGLLPATSGVIRLDGEPLTAIGPQEIARRVSYLPFGAPCHWPMTVERVVSLGRLPFQPAWQGLTAADWSIIDGAMERAEVGPLAQRSIERLSAGERTRVMLARSLAQQPRLLLADEPTATLDPYHQLRIVELLRDLALAGGAVLAVFHDLPLATRFCTRLALMKQGRIVADGSAAEVLTADNVRSAYGVELAAESAATFRLPS